jgi:hypothetical protein
MNLNKCVTSTITVVKPNLLDIHPGGWYNLNEDNSIELRIVKLRILQHHISMMEEDIAANGENRIHRHREAEHLADMLFDVYKPCIELGIDIFNAEGVYYEEKIDPLISKLKDTRAILEECLGCSEDAIEVSYLKALLETMHPDDLTEYRKLHDQATEHSEEANKWFSWPRDTKL